MRVSAAWQGQGRRQDLLHGVQGATAFRSCTAVSCSAVCVCGMARAYGQASVFQWDCARAFRGDRRDVRTADVAFPQMTVDREAMVAVE